jgi:hypothetical protein
MSKLKPPVKSAGKGGSPTSSKTATRTATKTSTVANPKGNVTVTGGAGDGDTQVIIGKARRKDPNMKVEGEASKPRADRSSRRKD